MGSRRRVGLVVAKELDAYGLLDWRCLAAGEEQGDRGGAGQRQDASSWSRVWGVAPVAAVEQGHDEMQHA